MNKTISFYLYLTASLLCVLLAVIFAWMGVSYVYEGEGLHPRLAIAFTVGSCLIGYFLACEADKSEQELG